MSARAAPSPNAEIPIIPQIKAGLAHRATFERIPILPFLIIPGRAGLYPGYPGTSPGANDFNLGRYRGTTGDMRGGHNFAAAHGVAEE